MLEEYYWIAGIITGIVAAIAAVVGIFRKQKSDGSLKNEQNINVSGSNHSVNQSANISNKEKNNSK